MFFPRPPHCALADRLAAELAAERRLSGKRLRMIEAQAREIERLTAVNASLATVALGHSDCLRHEDWASVLALVVGSPEAVQRRAAGPG